jgi:hypothetical protein
MTWVIAGVALACWLASFLLPAAAVDVLAFAGFAVLFVLAVVYGAWQLGRSRGQHAGRKD